MTKNRFLDFALGVGLNTARMLAMANGVTAAQIDLWVASLPTSAPGFAAVISPARK